MGLKNSGQFGQTTWNSISSIHYHNQCQELLCLGNQSASLQNWEKHIVHSSIARQNTRPDTHILVSK